MPAPRTLRCLTVAIGCIALLVVLPTASAVGEVYVTDSDLEVTDNSGGALPDGNPFPDEETVSLPGITLSASGSASVTIDKRNGTYTNLSAIDPGHDITVNQANKQVVVIGTGLSALDYASVEYTTATSSRDFVYTATSTGTLTLESTGLSVASTLNL